MNKYQEALNYLETMTRGKINNTEQYHNDKSSSLAIADLQELIDNYSTISQFDRAVFFNAKNMCVNGITYEHLEKALDMACEEIEHQLQIHNHNMVINGTLMDKYKWKEYLLKESEKE